VVNISVQTVDSSTQRNVFLTQYSETNVMHSSFNLLRIKGLYMFRALLAHLQEALHKRHLLYCVCVMSVGCTRTPTQRPVKANSHMPCCAHAVPLPCHAALIHTCHAAPLPFSDNAVSFVEVCVVAGNVRTASPTA
jgi:hypothetical protein